MKISVNSQCPCGSGKKYKKCCAILHKGAIAKDALQLMRSRYCAYAVGDTKYIINTTHHDNIDYSKDSAKWKKSILEFINNTDFQRLDIYDFTDAKDSATVTFKANMSSNDIDISFVEKSEFKKIDDRWYYLKGIIQGERIDDK